MTHSSDESLTISDAACHTTSCIIVTYVGANGDPHVSITSQSTGSFVVRAYTADGSFASTDGLNYIIINP